jgi:phosphatidylinositol alpha-mannosyltransferase
MTESPSAEPGPRHGDAARQRSDSRPWRIGIVCPYSWTAMGGVQVHIRDYTAELQRRGHSVSVLAPADEEQGELPDYVVSAGKPVMVPYNGSVAPLLLGPVSATRTRRWMERNDFDVVHVHEPYSPSVGLVATWASDIPLVGTWHAAIPRSRAITAFYGVLMPSLEKISARIAVSEEARRTLVEHLGGDPILIPNGVDVQPFAEAEVTPQWRAEGLTVCFLGRIDEPRKGLPVMLEAWPGVLRADPHARLLVAGPGDAAAASQRLPEDARDSVTFLGRITDAEKESMLATADVYVGPHLGGESFGIVLVEAMAAGAVVVASSLPAFRAVLDEGRLGELFPVGDAAALTETLLRLREDPARRRELAMRGREAAWAYDWSAITDEILGVYDLVVPAPRREA